MLKGYRGFMTRNISLLLVCTAIFLSLMLVTASAAEEELLGLDVYVVASYDTPGETRNVHGLASTVYVAGLGFGLGVFDVIERSRFDPNGHFLVNPDR